MNHLIAGSRMQMEDTDSKADAIDEHILEDMNQAMKIFRGNVTSVYM